MGKTRVALFLGSALLLWGCGEEASNENGEQEEAEEQEVVDDLEENWGTYLSEAADELDSYTTEIDMSGENLRGPNDDHGDIYLNMSVKGEFEEGYVEAALPNGQEFSVLYVEDRWFMNEGYVGKKWSLMKNLRVNRIIIMC